jgi:PAS domain S-box-containing protein
VGLVPLVAMSSLLVVGLETAVLLTLLSFILAELTAPLWQSFWTQLGLPRPTRRHRLMTALLHLIPLLIAGLIYRQTGGIVPFTTESLGDLNSLIWLTGGYGVAYFVLAILFWLIAQRPLSHFFRDNALSVLMSGFLAQPMAVLGGAIFVLGRLPIFVVYCLAVMIFSVVIWLSWQRRYIVEQQYAQFAALNSVGESLRASLDLATVLQHIYQLVQTLVPTDGFMIALLDEKGDWQRPFPAPGPGGFQSPQSAKNQQIKPFGSTTFTPDDFTRWVAEREKPLEVEARDLHFARRHNLTPPTPAPTAWLGLPLTSAERIIGVMVLQQFGDSPTFSRWHREILLAIAGQASAAIQNARLYSETLRLYNLTDEALAQRVQQLQALLDSIQEGVLMVDTNGRIALINPFAANLLGQPAPQLLGQRLDTAVAPTLGYPQASLNHLLTALPSGQLPAAKHTTFQRGERVVMRQEAPVLAHNQHAIGWLMLFRDVTEEHQLAEQKADLTRMIVHDLRNPITTLISTISLAQSELNGTMPVLDDARQGCLDMLDMVDSLMDITRMEAGQMVIEAEAIYLHPLVERITGRLQPLAGQRRLALTHEFAPDLPPVWADEEMVRRVLINLLDNALKFTPGNGRIHTHLQTEPADDDREPGLRCTISDTGPGILMEQREQVFNRFMRTNQGGAQVRGTGLGLAFCKMAVEAHNGRIWVQPAPDGGSQFIFTLPGLPRLLIT